MGEAQEDQLGSGFGGGPAGGGRRGGGRLGGGGVLGAIVLVVVAVLLLAAGVAEDPSSVTGALVLVAVLLLVVTREVYEENGDKTLGGETDEFTGGSSEVVKWTKDMVLLVRMSFLMKAGVYRTVCNFCDKINKNRLST